ncbi:hypothetical protein [Botrimarina hoheduenensis]|uniref:hypothetical protein n=1 Tax=Botrimarina hoheduenensis TaxID=2528000 RepID=UPI0018D3A832|nr:hypothetical protein [Botrimarina hoheduenensis]
MTRSPRHRRLQQPLRVLAMIALALVTAGCSGLPRIDPSGRRFLIWPEPPAPVTGIDPTLGNPLGNVNAAPVYAPGSGGTTGLPLTGGGVLTPVSGAPGQAPPRADERLSITPERVLAPVGSEVILRAGVCGPQDYLRTNRRIEWMLGTEGTGQFVTVGEQGEMDILRYPWQRPNKQDNTFAVGYTSPFHTCLNRGTADPTDDVQVRPGDAWITVTSASEGASYITAHAPESRDWDARRARATIYWVDAEWQIPPSLSVQPGQTAQLTTTVLRKTDGAPVQGWEVRYEVVQGSSARLGYASGEASIATTDAQGRATMQVTPTDDLPGTAVVRVTIARPAQSAPMPSPRLELGSGESVVMWTPSAGAGGGVIGPFTPSQGGSVPPTPFEPPPSDNVPPIGPADRGAPLLEVYVQRDNQRAIRVNDAIPVTITVENRGDAPARNLVIFDRFESGLANDQAPPGESQIKYEGRFPDLGPGESDVVRLEFRAVAPGRHCHYVRVTMDGTDAAVTEQCFAIEALPQAASPTLDIRIEAELRRTVGQSYELRPRVYNTSGTPAENLRVELRYGTELSPEAAEQGNRRIPGGFIWEVGRLEANSSAPFHVKFRCDRPNPAAELTLFVAADGVPEETRTVTVAIEPAAPTPTPSPPNVVPSALDGALSLSSNPARVGQPLTLDVAVANVGTTPLSGVEFRVTLPSQLLARLQPAQSPVPFRAEGGALVFGPIAQLLPNQPVRLTIPCDAAQQGTGDIFLQVRAVGESNVLTRDTPIRVEP